MKKIVIRGGHLVSPIEDRLTDLLIEGRHVVKVGAQPEAASADVKILDATDCWVTPGLIDLQVNGGPSCNFWGDPDLAQVSKFATELTKAGVTTILPTLITDDLDHLKKNIDFLEKEIGVGVRQLDSDVVQGTEIEVKAAAKQGNAKLKERPVSVRMPGIHLEGPFLSPEKPGVHPTMHLQPLKVDVLKRIMSQSVKLMTLAPELDPSGQAIQYLTGEGVTVALGHSNATFQEAEQAFNNDVRIMTHTFNALPPIHHRAPGAVTAALLDTRVSCCVIADGRHLAPAVVKLILKLKGLNKTILVTDIAQVGTSQGGLVGSSIFLDEAIRNIVKWGVASFQQAIQMATINPALSMGWEGSIGSLSAGKLADVVVWDKKSLAIKHVLVGGELLF